jgi:hypothetical protein
MKLAQAAPAALLLAAACGHLDEVDVTRSATVVVPGAAGGASLPVNAIGAIDLPIDRRALSQEGIEPNDVDSARLVRLRLEVTQGTSLEAWLDSVAFHVEAPGQARTLVAQKSGIRALAAGTTALDLDVPGADLEPYLLADRSTVTAEASGIQPSADTTVKVTATVRVDVSVSGLLH